MRLGAVALADESFIGAENQLVIVKVALKARPLVILNRR